MVPMAAQATDVDIGGYVPAPDGTTALLYDEYAERDRLSGQGRQAVTTPRPV